MKVLFDHNVPHKLRHSLLSHEVSTADEMDWAELQNGELLNVAEVAAFDVMVTGDKNMSYQQNLSGRNLAIVVLSTNDWRTIRASTQSILEEVPAAQPSRALLTKSNCS